ncbi:NUDIX hydrolase [Ochrobactrum vermis]|uniref:NUDIX hydrolase n=1 Tax=Ochrobactrum vermis TaxID=1827297 RepID=A0ABU8PB32_9HYPH|nr:NUDIX hydrolase [Ochrobactrum vermis]PQZ29926.1 DNA mismatch repair protein MutT [Ochrobactrum vermis]
MKAQAKQPIATEKRILTPSGRLQQVAALVYRRDMGALKVLVITSRGTGRWIIPKGWPQVGRTLAETALREAYEEAGIRGEVSPTPIGSFCYCKTDLPPERINQFTAAVFAVQFNGQEKDWPERDQRICEWVSPQEAADRVEETELKQILNQFGDSGIAAAAE